MRPLSHGLFFHARVTSSDGFPSNEHVDAQKLYLIAKVVIAVLAYVDLGPNPNRSLCHWNLLIRLTSTAKYNKLSCATRLPPEIASSGSLMTAAFQDALVPIREWECGRGRTGWGPGQ